MMKEAAQTWIDNRWVHAVSERFAGVYGSDVATLFHLKGEVTERDHDPYDFAPVGFMVLTPERLGGAVGIAWNYDRAYDVMEFGYVLPETPDRGYVRASVNSLDAWDEGGVDLRILEYLLDGLRAVELAQNSVRDEGVFTQREERRRGRSRVRRVATIRTLRMDAVPQSDPQVHQGGTHRSPCRHWVRPFKRRLKNGRVVLVRGHYRGVGTPTVPTVRVA